MMILAKIQEKREREALLLKINATRYQLNKKRKSLSMYVAKKKKKKLSTSL